MTATQIFKIAAIPADGVGLEVVKAGRAVLDSLAENSDGHFSFEWTSFPWGSAYNAEHGKMMADDGLEELKAYDAIYFGAVGWPSVPDHVSLWGTASQDLPRLRPVGQCPPSRVPPRHRVATP